VELFPAAVDISPEGVRLQMNGGLEAPAAACIAEFDTGGSPRTDGARPGIGDAPAGVDTPYHLGLSLSDDFTNQALYAAWRGGILCQDLGSAAGISLDTSILNLLTGDAFAEVFPESRPIGLRTRPRAAPTSAFGAGHDLDIQLNQLDVEFFAELDGRTVRALSVGLDGTVGADLAFDGSTGALEVLLDLNADNLTPSVSYNELVPAANDTIVASFGAAFGNLLDSVIGGLLPELAFTLPAFNGIGLQDLQLAGTGEWMGGYAFVGPVGYGSPDGGCGSDGGCGGGCSGGCSVGGTPMPHPAMFALGALVLLRRRKR
jgi:MYXO-CTERM domain-containing protein